MITVEVKGLNEVSARLKGMQKQISYAASRALTSMAYQSNAVLKSRMQSDFKGGATRYSLAAMKVTKATRETLKSILELRTDTPGKSRPYDKAIGHLFRGGTRHWRRMEGAFRRIGALQNSQVMAVPRESSWANPLDTYGNPKPSFIVQLISYFSAFGEVGYKANMTDKRRAVLAKSKQSVAGYKTINGVVYFISRGRGMWFGRPQHLPAGIWAKRGTHASDVAPVFLFVRAGTYRQMIDLHAIGAAVVDKNFNEEFNKELTRALANAK